MSMVKKRDFLSQSFYACEYCNLETLLTSLGSTIEQAERNAILHYKFFQTAHENSMAHHEKVIECKKYDMEIVAYING